MISFRIVPRALFIAFSLGGDKKVEVRNYAVSAGQHIDDAWPLSDAGAYFLRVHGPNGFFRELTGNRNDPLVELSVEPTADQSGNLQLTAQSDDLARSMRIIDNAYITPERHRAGDSAVADDDRDRPAEKLRLV